MITVCCADADRPLVNELFELFKTPFRFHTPGEEARILLHCSGPAPELPAPPSCVITYSPTAQNDSGQSNPPRAVQFLGHELPIYGLLRAFSPEDGEPFLVSRDGVWGVRKMGEETDAFHLGYDLLAELRVLFTDGQPQEWAPVPTLDLHIALLRECLRAAGVELCEVPPRPHGVSHFVCLTHDVDFARLRDHGLDHSTLGFLHRATVGSFRKWLRRDIPARYLAANLLAAAKTPLILAGLARDIWLCFDEYLGLEDGRPSTYFMIPYKDRPGENVGLDHPERRAARYDVLSLAPELHKVREAGCEIGLHGLDAWRDPAAAQDERQRIAQASGETPAGVRMHWLCFDEGSPAVLDRAGFAYDSTCGYNDAVGFRAGTAIVFRPSGTENLLEVPMHIQDMALFNSKYMDRNAAQAMDDCMPVADHVLAHGGVLTLLWHMRSVAPERNLGEFYQELLQILSERATRFATAADIAAWFRGRRGIIFGDDGDDGAVLLAEGAATQGYALLRYPAGARTAMGQAPAPRETPLQSDVD
ncbi:hypothetical protein [Oceanidesulfovibrio marinus]|uniref:Nodulation protein B n=1 Tax=Oceanidesulfovibrio marinus TaxID=370038 RepID=A0A6P1ZCW6_9BACT|nr:hypothetical protein [Oceanidesulfovibrio marinus]TVM32100.1 hypothetical protein DQK91_16345 [Oceanidesulfovibrio marinus]